MNEWGNEVRNEETHGVKNNAAGKWDGILTLVALLATGLVSFGIAWLTKDIPSRPFWLLGICFAAPVAALMLAVFLKEKVNPTMTPSTSRKAQLVLALCSVTAAAAVGCFCQVSNEKAETVEHVKVGEGWSDVLIILDKSGSMSMDRRDEIATKAVIDLLDQMDESTKVGMLIDVGWTENNQHYQQIALGKRMLEIAPLQGSHRQALKKMARMELGVNEHFPRAFETACEMLERHGGEPGSVSIIMVSDGNDCTGEFRADDFADQLKAMGVKVNYLYVAPGYSEEVEKLAEVTGGASYYAQKYDQLLGQMQQMVSVPVYSTVYKDALRDIQESNQAKVVTGILLLILGLLIGFSLLIMLSNQGQRRFQLALSPLMAILAFVILSFGSEWISIPWIREGIAFTCMGVVMMRKNSGIGNRVQARKGSQRNPVSSDVLDETMW